MPRDIPPHNPLVDASTTGALQPFNATHTPLACTVATTILIPYTLDLKLLLAVLALALAFGV